MKYGFLLAIGLFASNAMAQVFHFEDDHTVIIKNTLQSPAHWYLEIANDCGVDTTLRWIAEFQSIPSQWSINLDAQNQAWSVVEDGDSSDFILMANPDLPQKLIIGAMLNNTPGHGSVFFHIFDPENRTQIQTIEYEFIISQAGLAELESSGIVSLAGQRINVKNEQSTTFRVFDESGKLLLESESNEGISLSELPAQLPLVITIGQQNKHLVFTLMR